MVIVVNHNQDQWILDAFKKIKIKNVIIFFFKNIFRMLYIINLD